MILITMVKEDGTEGDSYPFPGNDVDAATKKFMGFVKENPLAGLGSKTAKINRVIELEEITEITIPEPDILTLIQDAHEMLSRNDKRKL